VSAYLYWIGLASDGFVAVGLLTLVVTQKGIIDATPVTKLITFSASGIGLCLLSASLFAPSLSPRAAITGHVRGFHQVREYRNSYFSFSIVAGESSSPELHADYFDRGFYYDDSAVSNGDVVSVVFLEWTRTVVSMNELSGKHSGWSFESTPKTTAPIVIGLAGIALIVGGIIGVSSDIMARPEPDLAS